jgi:ankyrin repeat protein
MHGPLSLHPFWATLTHFSRQLAARGLPLDLGDYDGRTAAHLAASNGQLAALRYVLGPAGARANVRDRYGAPSHRPWRHFCTTLYNLCRDSLRK